jgi:hypothetical protein
MKNIREYIVTIIMMPLVWLILPVLFIPQHTPAWLGKIRRRFIPTDYLLVDAVFDKAGRVVGYIDGEKRQQQVLMTREIVLIKDGFAIAIEDSEDSYLIKKLADDQNPEALATVLTYCISRSAVS